MAEETAGKKFRFNAKQIGLTYSCPATAEENPIPGKDALLAGLQAVSTIPLEQYIISKERHESGKIHYHVYAKWAEKLDLSSARAFDLHGVHPNILTGTPKSQWKTYIVKDGDYITNFYVPKVTKYAEALSASTVEEGLALLAEYHPRDYLLQRERLKANLEAHRSASTRPSTRELLPMSAYGESIAERVRERWTTRAIVIIGATNLGKTSFAKRLGATPYLVSHMDQLKCIPTATTHLIFDDMSFSHLPRSGVLHLMDLEEDRAIHVRYSTANLPSSMPRIFTTNEDDFLGYADKERVSSRRWDPAIERRIEWIEINERLFYFFLLGGGTPPNPPGLPGRARGRPAPWTPNSKGVRC